MSVVVEDAAQELQLMFQSPGWRYVAKPGLERRIQHLTQQLVLNQRLEMPQIREIQAQIKLLQWMLDSARRADFFLFELQSGDTGGES